jgi:hypothetical protein
LRCSEIVRVCLSAWDFRFSQRRAWRWRCSDWLRRVIWYKLAHVLNFCETTWRSTSEDSHLHLSTWYRRSRPGSQWAHGSWPLCPLEKAVVARGCCMHASDREGLGKRPLLSRRGEECVFCVWGLIKKCPDWILIPDKSHCSWL